MKLRVMLSLRKFSCILYYKHCTIKSYTIPLSSGNGNGIMNNTKHLAFAVLCSDWKSTKRKHEADNEL